MDEFLIHHYDFARWALLCFGLGLVITPVWAWRFRRLTRTGIPASERRWEARSGMIAGVGWIAALLLIALLMRASAEIHAVEAYANSDEISPLLVENVTYGLDLIAGPMAVIVGVAIGWLVIHGLWSGALTTLRGREGER